MVDVELLMGWMGSFLIIIIFFKVLNKKTKKSTPLSLVLKIIAIGLCLHSNVIPSLLLYEPIMKVFNINTDGFMNLNGIFTLAIIWLLTAVIVFIIVKAVKEQLGSYYKTIRITQIVLISLLLLIVFLFLFVVNLK